MKTPLPASSAPSSAAAADELDLAFWNSVKVEAAPLHLYDELSTVQLVDAA